jgi:L-lactate dehydrogenase complex protein LldG
VSIDKAVLQRLSARIARGGEAPAHAPHRAAETTAVATPARPESPTSFADNVGQFTTAWEGLGGVVHHAHHASDVVSIVSGICREAGASRILSWREADLGLPGIIEGLRGVGIESDHGWLPADASQRAARLAALEPLQVGVTGAAGGIAESGTVVLVSGPGRPRLASLLPPVHVTLLAVSRIRASLPDLLTAEPAIAEGGSNLVLITGPSRTADIEMTLTRGVHGPGHVHVVLLHGVRS